MLRIHTRFAAGALAIFIFAGGAPWASAAGAKPSGYRTAYFAATTPGSWSRYAVTTEGKTESTYTYRRLADEDGRAQVELRADFTAGQFEGTWSTTRYVLARSFRLEDDAISYARHCESLSMLSDKMTEPMDLPAESLPNIVETGIDYAASVRFAGTANVAGRDCDHYTYHYVTKGQNPTTFDGELWMNPAIPYGIVRESASIQSKLGPTSSYSMTLAAVGQDAVAPARETAKHRRSEGAMSLLDAYNKGLVGLEVRVDPDSHHGERLFIVAVNKSEAPLHLTVPGESMSFEAGAPLDSLDVHVEKALKLDIGVGEKSREILVDQEGNRRVTDGKFTLVIYEGEPLFAGSVTSGPSKEP